MGNPNPIFEMNIGSFGNIFQRKQQDLPERDAAGLPYTIKENIDTLTREYEDAAQHGGRESIEKCFNLTWALVHSHEKSHVHRGMELIDAMLSSESADHRELLYLRAVGHYRLKQYLAARQTLKEILETSPDFRQAQTLLDAAESEIVKDGIVGLSAAAAIIGVVGAITISAMKKR